MPVTALFKAAGLVESANQARTMIGQGGLAINGNVVTDPHARIDTTWNRERRPDAPCRQEAIQARRAALR